MKDELKPCPFCGGKAGLDEWRYRGTGASGMETPYPFVVCNGCGVRTVPVRCDDSPYGKRSGEKTLEQAKSDAIAAWNARTPDPRIAELEAEVARLREALEDVLNPLDYLQRYAERRGSQLGGMAYAVANDPATVRDIARAALKGNTDDR